MCSADKACFPFVGLPVCEPCLYSICLCATLGGQGEVPDHGPPAVHTKPLLCHAFSTKRLGEAGKVGVRLCHSWGGEGTENSPRKLGLPFPCWGLWFPSVPFQLRTDAMQSGLMGASTSATQERHPSRAAAHRATSWARTKGHVCLTVRQGPLYPSPPVGLARALQRTPVTLATQEAEARGL